MGKLMRLEVRLGEVRLGGEAEPALEDIGDALLESWAYRGVLPASGDQVMMKH